MCSKLQRCNTRPQKLFSFLCLRVLHLPQVPYVTTCLEGNTMSNPVHTSETRMCGDFLITLILPGRQYIAKNQVRRLNRVQPFRLVGGLFSVRRHPLLRRVCTSVLPYGQALCGVLIVLPSWQFRPPET